MPFPRHTIIKKKSSLFLQTFKYSEESSLDSKPWYSVYNFTSFLLELLQLVIQRKRVRGYFLIDIMRKVMENSHAIMAGLLKFKPRQASAWWWNNYSSKKLLIILERRTSFQLFASNCYAFSSFINKAHFTHLVNSSSCNVPFRIGSAAYIILHSKLYYID